MAENWNAIAAEVAVAIASVGFPATVTRSSGEPDEPQTPWDPPAIPANAPVTFTVTVIDDGIKNRYDAGSLVARRVRVLTVGVGPEVPLMADVIRVRGVDHVINAVNPFAPGGVDLLYEIELNA